MAVLLTPQESMSRKVQRVMYGQHGQHRRALVVHAPVTEHHLLIERCELLAEQREAVAHRLVRKGRLKRADLIPAERGRRILALFRRDAKVYRLKPRDDRRINHDSVDILRRDTG